MSRRLPSLTVTALVVATASLGAAALIGLGLPPVWSVMLSVFLTVGSYYMGRAIRKLHETNEREANALEAIAGLLKSERDSVGERPAVVTMKNMARATVQGDHANGMGMSRDCVAAQYQLEQQLRKWPSAKVRARIRFIDRPTSDDIMDAVRDRKVIVVRVHIPERWRKGCKPDEGLLKVLRRCRSILHELGLRGGHPRVFLIADSCETADQFKAKVYERFGA